MTVCLPALPFVCLSVSVFCVCLSDCLYIGQSVFLSRFSVCGLYLRLCVASECNIELEK